MTVVSPITAQLATRRTDRVAATVKSQGTRTDLPTATGERRRREQPVAIERRRSRQQRAVRRAMDAPFVAQVIAQAFGFDKPAAPPAAYVPRPTQEESQVQILA